LAVVLLGAAAWAVVRWSRPSSKSQTEDAIQATRVWGGPELTVASSFSADARHVFYVEWTRGDLVVLDLATRHRRHLTHNATWFHPHDRRPEWAWEPVASPDGTHVAFSWGMGSQGEVHVARVDGGGNRAIYRDDSTEYAGVYDWCRDGRWLLVGLTKSGGRQSLVVMSASDGRVTFEKAVEALGDRAALSPDGRFIAYDRPSAQDPEDRDIWTISTGTGRENPLVQHPAIDSAPVWSADGTQVLFLSDRTGTGALWSQRTAGGLPQGPPELVKPDMTRARPMGIDADGTLFYAVIRSMDEVMVVDLEPRSNVATGTPQPVPTLSVGTRRGVAWSPDGTRLAYIRGVVRDTYLLFSGNRSETLWVRSIASGSERQVTCPLTALDRPRWSPDGRSLLIFGDGPGHSPALYQLDVELGSVIKVAAPSASDWPRQHGWFGGNTAFFYKYQGGPTIVRDIDTGQERTISPPADDNVAVSNDGRWLAYSTHDAASGRLSLMALAVGSSTPQELVRMASPEWISALTWMPDGRHVVFARARRDTFEGELFTVSLDGARPSPVGVKTHNVVDIQITPDGRRLAYYEVARGGEVWRLSNARSR
jgi:Tol biopolymer transport system component